MESGFFDLAIKLGAFRSRPQSTLAAFAGAIFGVAARCHKLSAAYQTTTTRYAS
jgi:hypothetical protein